MKGLKFIISYIILKFSHIISHNISSYIPVHTISLPFHTNFTHMEMCENVEFIQNSHHILISPMFHTFHTSAPLTNGIYLEYIDLTNGIYRSGIY